MPLVLKWMTERWGVRYKVPVGFVNWYAVMPDWVFYLLAFGLPLLAAVLGGLWVARYGVRGAAAAGILVFAVAGILAFTEPTLDRLHKRAGGVENTVCRFNLRQLALIHLMYTYDYDGRLPRAEDWHRSLEPYLPRRTTSRLLCPADDRPGSETGGELQTSYAMAEPLSGALVDEIDEPAAIPLLFDGTVPHGRHETAAFRHPKLWLMVIPGEPGLNVAYADRHVAWVSAREWEALSPAP